MITVTIFNVIHHTNFLFCKQSRPAVGPTLPPIKCVLEAVSLGVKHLAHYSPPCSSQVKNEWMCIFTAAIYLHGVHRDNFTSAVIKTTEISFRWFIRHFKIFGCMLPVYKCFF